MNQDGAQEYYNSCYKQYADWGVDFVKVDDISRPYHADEITAIRKAIELSGRNMVYSLSPGSTPITARYHVQNNADMWRISEDFWDSWPQLKSQFRLASIWMKFHKEGHWPDLDMLPVGILATRSSDGGVGKRSSFSQDELKTLMSLWCMFRSPLILGGDVTQLNSFEKDLITNKELLNIDQNSKNCVELVNDGSKIIYRSENTLTGEKYIALFNLTDERLKFSYPFTKFGIANPVQIKDIWNNSSSSISHDLTAEVNPHGVALYKIADK